MALASHGFNTLLLSRTQSKLERLAEDIKSRCSDIQTKVLLDPFNTYTSSDNYNELEGLIEHLNVAILVNNNSQLHSTPVPFILTNKEDVRDIICQLHSNPHGHAAHCSWHGSAAPWSHLDDGFVQWALRHAPLSYIQWQQSFPAAVVYGTCSRTQARRRGWELVLSSTTAKV